MSGAFAYLGSKYQNQIGGKTGTAEVQGKLDTSWLATWGPTYKDESGNTKARFVMVGMVEQAGTGATAAGPCSSASGTASSGSGRSRCHRDASADDAADHRPAGAGEHPVTAYSARDPREPFRLTSALLPLDRRTRGYDLPLAGIALVLSFIGALLVWAATRDQQRLIGGNPQSFLYRHLFNVVLAFALMFLASRLDARLLRLFGPIVYVASVLGLLLVFVAGSTINGARAWIVLPGGFELQPSEFCKLGLIVGMAVLFTHRSDEWDDEVPPDDP